MSIVANLQVGNEVEIIDRHIAYHLALGVSGFVIADLDSEDGTSERLERYRGDPRFVIRRYALDSLIDETGPRTPEVGRWMLEAAREHFAPDWIVRMDADEFLHPFGELGSVLLELGDEPCFQIERRNVIFESGLEIPSPPVTPAALAEFSVVAEPVSTNAADYGADDSVPLILTKVGPKVIFRPQIATAYATGGHGVLDERGRLYKARTARNLGVVHFWFTTPGRFARKGRFAARTKELLSRNARANQGWQWSRWARIVEAGDSPGEPSLDHEYQRQFPQPQVMEQLRRSGMVRSVADAWTL